MPAVDGWWKAVAHTPNMARDRMQFKRRWGAVRTVQHHGDRGGDGAALDHPIDLYTPRQSLHGLVAVVLEQRVDAGLLRRRVRAAGEVGEHAAAAVALRFERRA